MQRVCYLPGQVKKCKWTVTFKKMSGGVGDGGI